MAELTRLPNVREFLLVPVRNLDGSEAVADGGQLTHIEDLNARGAQLANGRLFPLDALVAVWWPTARRLG